MISENIFFLDALPPRMYLEQVLDLTSSIYCFLWDKKDEENRIEMTWKEVTHYHNKTAFKTSLRKLNNQGLLDYHQDAQGVFIELVGWTEGH